MPTQAGLQEVGELAVAVGDVAALGGEGGKDVPDAAEALVDGAGLRLALTFRLAAVQALAVERRRGGGASLTGESKEEGRGLLSLP